MAKYPWVCGRCDRRFTSRNDREATCPDCGNYQFSPTGKVKFSSLPESERSKFASDSEDSA